MGDLITGLLQKYQIEEPEQFGSGLDFMIIEPHSEVRLIISSHLQKIGFPKVRSVKDGLLALQELRTQRANVILISNEIETPTALDIISEVREDVRIHREVVLLGSTPLSREELMAAVDKGFDGFLIKPYVMNELVVKLKAAHAAFSSPKNPERVYEFAKQSLRQQEVGKAEDVYKTMAENAARSARPLVGLARVARLKGEIESAVSNAQMAIQRNENYTHAHILLGELHLLRGDFESASRCFRRALELSPHNLLTYEASIDSLLQAQRIDDAIDLLTLGIKAAFQHPYIIKRLGNCYFRKKDYHNAVRFLRQAVSLEPDNLSNMNSLAICYRDSKLYEDALNTYNAILKKDNENYAVMFNKSLLLNMMGRSEDAIKLLKRIVLNKPDFQKAKDKLIELGGTLD